MFHPRAGKISAVVLVDPTTHASYFSPPHPDYYIILWEESLKTLPDSAKTKSKIISTGPLARPAFYDVAEKLNSFKDKIYFKEKLGLSPDKRYCLIMAGGAWISRAEKFIPLFDKHLDGDIEFVFVCGRNTRFCNKMTKRYGNNPRFRFLSWLNETEISEWMGACDYGIFFSVAQTLTEAGLCLLPVYLFSYIKGQETAYKDIIIDRGLGQNLTGNRTAKVLAFKNLIGQNDPALEVSMLNFKKYLENSKNSLRDSLKELL